MIIAIKEYKIDSTTIYIDDQYVQTNEEEISDTLLSLIAKAQNEYINNVNTKSS